MCEYFFDIIVCVPSKRSFFKKAQEMIKVHIEKTLKASENPLKIDVKIHVSKGMFASLYGASGAGKTSTLRMISGLLEPDHGLITNDEDLWFDSNKNVTKDPKYRNIGYVFQDSALFPNMTVFENLEYALTNKRDTKHLYQLIALMKLDELCNQKPATLSGGQKQRVALARALAQKPALLLLDEPLASLDNESRAELQDCLLQVHKTFHLTTLLVSHDITEILKLSDQVFVMDHGKITQQGSPKTIFIQNSLNENIEIIGEISKIERQGILFCITVSIQNTSVKIMAKKFEIENLKVGDEILVGAKNFNPFFLKPSK
jgi:molybdate transport system ATP-binding protein